VLAATEALAAAGEPNFDRPELGYFQTGSWSNRPPGCVVDLHQGRIRYNRASSGTNNGGEKLVCDTRVGAANYTGASARLCSRKRRGCWWTNDVAQTGTQNCDDDYAFGRDTSLNPYWWTEDTCRVKVQVNIDGRVSVVHPGGKSTRRVEVNSQMWFRVRWADGAYPTAASGCTESCVMAPGTSGDTCVCDVAESTRVVFTDATTVPSRAEVEENLRIGSVPPAHFDDGTYTLCVTAACLARSGEVRVFTTGTASTPIFDQRTIFVIVVNETAPSTGRTLHFANKESTVTIANASTTAAFAFRNPPKFVTLVDPTERDATYETEALLDHLFTHMNVAPFISYHLIQRLVTSNPSPRYVAMVSAAFRTGEYAGTNYSGQYGDLGAAVAATLTDREARSLVLDADPTHGQMREPLLKLYHFMRAMEYMPRDHREVDATKYLYRKIGQAPYDSPTVFSFFTQDFSAEGPVQDAGLVAPEAQLGILPFVIGFLDGMSALIFDGLAACMGGFGTGLCDQETYPAAWSTNTNAGYLSYSPDNASSTEAVVNELDLLLSAGRLDDKSRADIVEEYNRALNFTSCPVERIDLCGRLQPGESLMPGEYFTNANGEVLCFTYDGVARHIGANGTELFSTAYATRGTAVPLNYGSGSNGQVSLAGPRSNGQWHTKRWIGDSFAPGSYAAFHSFLAGPCKVVDQRLFERATVYKQNTYRGYAPTLTTTCTATSTCGGAPQPTPSPDYVAERARTDSEYALKIAQNLFVASAAFSTTNDPATTDVIVPPQASHVSLSRPYKALVVLFMAGGADTFNLLVPHSNCDSRNVSTQYYTTRGAAALPYSTLLPITLNASQLGQQVCDTFGLHPTQQTLKQLWEDGDAAFVANVGALVEPLTKDEYIFKRKELPAAIFSHNLQTQGAQTLTPQETTGNSGILGRILTALETQAVGTGAPPLKTAAYSVTASRTIFRGSPTEPILLGALDGMLTYDGSQTATSAINPTERPATLAAISRLVSKESTSIFGATHNMVMRRSLFESNRIAAILRNATLTQNWASAQGRASTGHGGEFVGQLMQVASVIVQRHALEAERDVFYVSLGGFDHHADVLPALQEKYDDVNVAIGTFVAEMKALGLWDAVTIQSLSEFGRTMTSNGRGTDHAWGGNHWTMGGAVRGGLLHGTYPELRVDGPNCLSSTCPLLPTSPWETIWKPLAEWLGVRNDKLPEVMPNLQRFPPEHLLNVSILFKD